ncbi:MAG: hypothetical protein H7831_12550 [Magnetococcus sp. WYHC-3]
MSETRLPLLLVGDFTLQPLADMLRALPGMEAHPVRIAPFDAIRPVLLEQAARPESEETVLLVWGRPEGLFAGFRSRLEGNHADLDGILREVDAFADMVAAAALRCHAVLVVNWSLAGTSAGGGLTDLSVPDGVAYALLRMNLRLAERLSGGGGGRSCWIWRLG